jgi:LPXTG-motif cell wall-anchored protein
VKASDLRYRRRYHDRGVLVLAFGVAIGIALALTASAAVTGGLALGVTTVDPSGSTSVDTTFAEDNGGGVLGGTIVSIIVTPVVGATGSVNLDTADFTCVPNTGIQVDCLWTTGSAAKAVSLTATASADASGTFDITTEVTGDDPDTPSNELVTRQVASASLAITPPPTTTTLGTTTTTVGATTTSIVPTTTTTSEQLPLTGPPPTYLAFIAGAIVVLGLGGVVFGRRNSDDRI